MRDLISQNIMNLDAKELLFEWKNYMTSYKSNFVCEINSP